MMQETTMQRKAQHTPGPWVPIWGKGGEAAESLAKADVHVAVQAKGCVVAVCGDYLDEANRSQSVADAFLIAAAPDLLAACKDIRDFLRSRGYDLRIVEAAIAKATGGES